MATIATRVPIPAGQWVEIDRPAADLLPGKKVLVQCETSAFKIGGPSISIADGFTIPRGSILEHGFEDGGGDTRDRLYVGSASAITVSCYWTGV